MICQSFNDAEEAVLYSSMIGGMLGCWAACVVIPLDWNRPWQYWPIPNSVGTMVGSILGVIVGFLFLCPVLGQLGGGGVVPPRTPAKSKSLKKSKTATPVKQSSVKGSPSKRSKSPVKAKPAVTPRRGRKEKNEDEEKTPRKKTPSPVKQRRTSSRIGTPRK